MSAALHVDALRRRLHAFDAPGGQVDLTTLPNATLRYYGIPPRPERDGPHPAPRRPALQRAAWDRAFGRPLRLQKFVFRADLLAQVDYRIARRRDIAVSSATRFETSRNWAGGYITANQGRHFSQVWGFWRIPAALTVPQPPFQGTPGIDYRAANWIGLDGQRAYFNSSLPQIGTSVTLDHLSGQITAQSWIQWWARCDPDPLGPLPFGLAVSPGDEIAAVLTVLDPTTVIGVMANLTTGVALPAWATAPPVPLSGVAVKPTVMGATAEWILERPAILPPVPVPGPPTPYNLPDYGRTGFHLCVAVESEAASLDSLLLTGRAQDLSGARLIRMFDVLPDPTRTAYNSMPRKFHDIALEIRFGGFR